MQPSEPFNVTLAEELIPIRDKMYYMFDLVAETVETSFTSMREGDPESYDRAEKGYELLREECVQIEDICFEVLANHTPDDMSTRYITVMYRISVYFERIGRSLYMISRDSRALYGDRSTNTIKNVVRMGLISVEMLKGVRDAIITNKVEKLYAYAELFDEIRSLNNDILRESVDFIKMAPEMRDNRIHFMSVSRYVERIADDLCRLAEEVIYAVTFERVRLA